MIFRVTGYIIYASMIPQGNGTFLITVRADPLNEGGPVIDAITTCHPCSYEEARATCYRLTAEVSRTVHGKGGQVVDVVVDDAPFGR